jgi:hypothetical protein
MRTSSAIRIVIVLAITAAATQALAEDDPCAAFLWNVTQERALFGTKAELLAAGRDAASAPGMQVDRLYEWTLVPQEEVMFAAAPGKRMLTDGARAGLVRLQIAAAGTYRVSVDQPFWVDVVAGGKLLPSKDFRGAPGCQAPHKILEFVLPAHQDLLIQLSGAVNPHARLTVTRAP